MPIDINKVFLVGIVDGDPRVVMGRTKKIAILKVRTWDRDDETGKNRYETHTVVLVPPRMIAMVEKSVKGGAAVLVEGRLEARPDHKLGWVTEVQVKRTGMGHFAVLRAAGILTSQRRIDYVRDEYPA